MYSFIIYTTRAYTPSVLTEEEHCAVQRPTVVLHLRRPKMYIMYTEERAVRVQCERQAWESNGTWNPMRASVELWLAVATDPLWRRRGSEPAAALGCGGLVVDGGGARVQRGQVLGVPGPQEAGPPAGLLEEAHERHALVGDVLDLRGRNGAFSDSNV